MTDSRTKDQKLCQRCINGDTRTADGFHALSTGRYTRCADLPPYEEQSTPHPPSNNQSMREALSDVTVWLQSALDCKSWVWGSDQRLAAMGCVDAARALLAVETPQPASEGQLCPHCGGNGTEAIRDEACRRIGVRTCHVCHGRCTVPKQSCDPTSNPKSVWIAFHSVTGSPYASEVPSRGAVEYRPADETTTEPTVHGVIYDRPGWVCSMCGGWNHLQDKFCTHTHPGSPLKASGDYGCTGCRSNPCICDQLSENASSTVTGAGKGVDATMATAEPVSRPGSLSTQEAGGEP